MKDIKITDLQDKFIERNVPPYGRVLMVPGKDFDPDWEDALAEMGYGCVFTEIGQEKFTLVLLEKEEVPEEETAAKPEVEREDSGQFAKHRGAPAGRKVNHWSHADEERLIKRVEEMPRTTTFEDKCALLVQEFPGRTSTGLEKKYLKLKRRQKKRANAAKGKCPKCGLSLDLCVCAEEEREEQRVKDANREQVRKRVESETVPKGDIEDLPKGKSEEHVSAEAAGAQLDVPKTLAKLENYVTILLEASKVQGEINAKLYCAIMMQSLEVLERKGVLMIPTALREHYNRALALPDQKYREIFSAKVMAFLEASS